MIITEPKTEHSHKINLGWLPTKCFYWKRDTFCA